MTVKCQDCEMDADYLWKDGRRFLPICSMCVETWLRDEAEEEGRIINIDDVEDEEELKEMLNPPKKEKKNEQSC